MKDLKFEELEIIEGGNAAQKILGGVGLVAAGVGAACALPASIFSNSLKLKSCITYTSIFLIC